MLPTVSVCMISYNHEDFIEEAILGIIKQKTSFPFELIISDDASKDTTNEKIFEVTKDLPEHITLKYFRQNPNLGMFPNFEFVLNQCDGTYIAICEGDDYWIDVYKLQKQVDFLDQNFDYNLITGYVRQYSERDLKFVEPQNLISFTFTYKDMLLKNHCTTCTTMIRNFISKDNPLVLILDLGGDFQLWMKALGKNGKAMKMDQVLAVYRRHENSATGERNKKLKSYAYFENMVKENIRIAEVWDAYFDNEASYYVLKHKATIYKKFAKVSINRKKYKEFFLYYFLYLIYKLSSKINFSNN